MDGLICRDIREGEIGDRSNGTAVHRDILDLVSLGHRRDGERPAVIRTHNNVALFRETAVVAGAGCDHRLHPESGMNGLIFTHIRESVN